jgi:outer membrane autotransporter protein
MRVAFFGDGFAADFDTSSRLTVKDVVYVLGGTARFGGVSVAASQDTANAPLPDRGAHFIGGAVELRARLESGYGSVWFGGSAAASIAESAGVTAQDVFVEGSAQLALGAGAYLEARTSAASGARGDVIIGSGESQGGGARVAIKAGNNSADPARFDVQQLMHVGVRGALVMEDRSKLVINISDVATAQYGQGAAILGAYRGGLADLEDPATDDPYLDQLPGGATFGRGGLLWMRAESSVEINGRFYIGAAGAIEAAPTSRIVVNGDLHFQDDGAYGVEVDGDKLSLMTVTGVATIQEGAAVVFEGNVTQDSVDVPFFTAQGGYYDSRILPVSAFCTIGMLDRSIVIKSAVADSSGAVGLIAAAAGRDGYSENYSAFSDFADAVISSSSVAPELDERLSDYFAAAVVLAEDGNAGSAGALMQITGEDVMSAPSALRESLGQFSATLERRAQKVALALRAAPAAGDGEPLNRIWASGFGSWIRQEDSGGLYGYRYGVAGVMIGCDRGVAGVPGLRVGVNIALSKGRLRNNDALSRVDIDTVSFGAYGIYLFGSGVFLDASVGFGFTDNDYSSDQVVGGRIAADFSAKSFQAAANIGWNWDVSESLQLIPSVGLSWAHIRQEGWSERIVSDPNSLVLANWFEGSYVDYLEVPLTLRLSGTFGSGGVLFTPEAYLGAVIVADSPERDQRVGLVGSGESFSIRGIDSGKTRWRAGLSLKAQVTDLVDIFAGYSLEARKSYRAHSGQLGIGFSF